MLIQMPVAGTKRYIEPTPLDWFSFTISEDSSYADDEQDAATLAQVCAQELTGYLFSARILEIAKKEGRNPLIRNARPFTPQQLEKLEEAINEARNMADWMLSECQCAFGDDNAGRLLDYATKRLDAGLEYKEEPQQQALF